MPAPGGEWCRVFTDPRAGNTVVPVWRNLITAGHSQGAGMALLLGEEHALAGMVQLAGVDDTSPPGNTPAPWIAAYN